MRYPTINDIVKYRNKPNQITKQIPDNIVLKKSLFLPPGSLFSKLYNSFIFYMNVEKYITQNSIVYFFIPHLDIIKRIKKIQLIKKIDVIKIFDIIHNWWEIPWRRDKNKFFAEYVIKYSDIVITDSELLFNKLKTSLYNLSLILPGFDEKIWGSRKTKKIVNKDELKGVFFGNLRNNNDIELINGLSKIKNVKIDAYGLINVNNLDYKVSYKGQLVNKELAKKIIEYDFILLPYDKSSFSNSISPAKYFESLRTGLPIISNSRLSVKGWNDYTYKISTYTYDEIKKIVLGHNRTKKENQILFSMQHTWTNRYNILNNLICFD